MRLVCAGFALFVPLILGGCGYIHFGRLPTATTGLGDAATATAYSNLATEHKILKQELALVRKEGDALRIALDRAGSAPGGTGVSGELAARLEETSRELATLRANFARLQAERSGSSAAANSLAMAASKAGLEDKLAASLRSANQLQEENTRLRADVTRTQSENVALAEQLKAAALQAERTQIVMAQLNTDLLVQKEARDRAEQTVEAVRSQLSTVLAHRGASTAAEARETPATVSSALQIAKAPPADSSPSAEFRVNTEQLRAANRAPVTPPGRVHIVRPGDTLEKIARQYFNVADRWRAIYEANLALLGNGQPLSAGMELVIPDVPAAPKSD